MSFYGVKTFGNLFSVHKKRLAANQNYRFGGAHAHIAYSVTGEQVAVVTLDSGVELIEAGANDVVSVVLMGLKVDVPPVITNLVLVDVAESATLPPDAYGVLVEGSVTVNDVVLNADTDVHLIEPSSVVTGAGKLVTFTFVQN